MYSLAQLEEARSRLIGQDDPDLRDWLSYCSRLSVLLQEPLIKEYINLLNIKLPFLYANNQNVQLLQRLNLAIEQAKGSSLKDVNNNGQLY